MNRIKQFLSPLVRRLARWVGIFPVDGWAIAICIDVVTERPLLLGMDNGVAVILEYDWKDTYTWYPGPAVNNPVAILASIPGAWAVTTSSGDLWWSTDRGSTWGKTLVLDDCVKERTCNSS